VQNFGFKTIDIEFDELHDGISHVGQNTVDADRACRVRRHGLSLMLGVQVFIPGQGPA
jgi:hypothetical protein